MTALRTATVVLAWAICALPAYAQSSPGEAQFRQYPFNKWATENAKPQIAWDVRISPPQLSVDQRLVVYLGVMIGDTEIQKLESKSNGRLRFFVRIEDSAGRRYEAGDEVTTVRFHGGGLFPIVEYSVSAFVVPGNYIVSLALCDGHTLEHSFVRRRLHVAEISHDPLPGAWNGLPPVEFLPPVLDLGVWSLPEIATGIRLPVKTQRPVRVELLVNTTPSRLDSANMFRQNMSRIAPVLKVLMGIDPSGGSIGLSVVDINRRVVSYQQPDLRAVDWVELRRALASFNNAAVDAAALAGQSKMLDYLAGVAVRLLDRADRANDVAPVLIVLSAPVYFKQQDRTPPPNLPSDPGRRIFYIRSDAGFELPTVLTDDIELLLRPMGARTFRVARPEELRKALGAILDEIAKIPASR